jgi:quercetin dioxygenase-like cupin family protein
MQPQFVKKSAATKTMKEPGKLFHLLLKSPTMEAVVAEMQAGTSSKLYQHEGEEIHLMLEGKMEYVVGNKTYKMEKGDTLWHRSDVPHGARNVGSDKAIYLTVGSPPTFM